MREYGRYQDYQTRDRESSRYGRDMGGDRGGWGDEDRSRPERARGGGMFGSGRGRDDEDYRNHDRSRSSQGALRGDSGRGGGEGRQRERHFGYDDNHEGLPIDETGRLIGSNKVEGTAVYSRSGSRLGSIYNFMVDKRSGKVEYAVMTYGGFLGMGTRYYPLPWDILEYDTRLGGYRVDMLERDLERAPSFDRDSEPEFDRRYSDRVRGWYGLGS
ncbi:MAG TPA: PRC-barrel domain-containing protein [Allosphingosinicella sp.]